MLEKWRPQPVNALQPAAPALPIVVHHGSNQGSGHATRTLISAAHCVFAAVIGSSSTHTSLALAADDSPAETVDLAWARSADVDTCLSGSDLKRAVRKRLGRDPFVAPFHQTVDGFVSRKAGKWSADLVVRGHQGALLGSRHLESTATDCRELDEAVVLTVTLIIDPNATLQPEPATATATTTATAPDQPKSPNDSNSVGASSPREVPPLAYPRDAQPAVSNAATTSRSGPAPAAPPAPPSSMPMNAPVTTSAASPASARQNELATTLGYDADSATRLVFAPSLVYNLFPGLAAAFALRDEVRLSRNLGLDASVSYLPERTQHIGTTLVGYDLAALGLAACYRPDRPITLLACAGGFAGVTHATVYRGEPDRPGARFWAGARADLGVSATSERLVAEFRAFGMVPITRWRFTSAENGTLFESAILAPGAEIAVGIRLP